MEKDYSPETILQEALEIVDSSERAVYLDQACNCDAALREEVESLLQAHLEADDFMSPITDQVWEHQATERIGSRVGCYLLMEKIAEGGFGVVFRAEQQEPVRRVVALKVIKPGMDSKEVISRFELERQALAMMDHPNIAKVYDAGTTEQGRPFFAMELVDGEPLTGFCDARQLGIRDRLKLFAQICLAIQHAHQKGIIHRDLKPSNILVGTSDDGSPFPKVIDFGVAKAISPELTPSTMITIQGLMMGTPRYMSPEQAGLTVADVDTRSDIYSLGVILYELMTGSAPLREKKMSSASFDEVRQMICKFEPGTPSDRINSLSKEERSRAAIMRQTEDGKLRRHLKGDLDWIVMKALEKDRERRYDTAKGLAADIERYLDGMPVEAGPPGAAYRVGKFVRRHRWPVAVATLAVLALMSLLLAGFLANEAELKAIELAKLGEVEDLKLKIEKVKSMRVNGSGGSREEALDLLEAVGRYPRDEIVAIKGEKWMLELIESARNELMACLLWTDLKESRLPVNSRIRWPKSALGPSHRNLALSRGEGKIEVQGPAFSKLLERPENLAGDLTGPLCFNSGSDLLAAGYGDSDGWELIVWNWAENRIVDGRALPGVGDAFDFHPKNEGFVMGTREETAGGIFRWKVKFFGLDGSASTDELELPVEPLVIRYSPDGLSLAISFKNQGDGIMVIDLESGKRTPVGEKLEVSSLAWDPDGNAIVAGDDSGALTVFDRNSGKVIFSDQKHNSRVEQVAWSHDGLLIASGGRDDVIHLWDSRQGELLYKSEASARTLSFSQDDGSLGPVSPNSDPKALSILEVQRSPACHRTVGHSAGSITASVWYPAATFLVTGASDGLRLWNRRGEQLDYFPKILVQPGGLACSQTHLFLAEKNGISRLKIEISGDKMEFGPKKLLSTLGDGQQIALRPESGNELAVAHNDEVVLLDRNTGAELRRLTALATTQSLSFSPDGNWLAAGTQESRGVRIWNLESGDPVVAENLEVAGGATAVFFPLAKDLANKPLPVRLLTGDAERYILWNLEKGRFVKKNSLPSNMEGREQRMPHIAWSPRGTALVVSIERKNLQILNPSTLEVMMQPGFQEQWPLNISPDGRLLANEAIGGRLFLWSFQEARRELRLLDLDWENLERFPPELIQVIPPKQRE